ncbi:hypothetical protein BDW75DRAFT_220131 [Aspergillus navahoensis]
MDLSPCSGDWPTFHHPFGSDDLNRAIRTNEAGTATIVIILMINVIRSGFSVGACSRCWQARRQDRNSSNSRQTSLIYDQQRSKIQVYIPHLGTAKVHIYRGCGA